MKGSALTRGLRIIGDLVGHPRLIPSYFRYSRPGHKTPLEVGLPWLTFSAIEYLDKHIRPDMTVFEYGSGGSTIFFARRTAMVTSVEENQDWIDLVKQKLAVEELHNVQLLHRPFDFQQTTGFQASAYLHALEGQPYDIILIDGTDFYTHEARPHCFRRAENFIRPRGIIVVDDAWRYDALGKENRANRHLILQGLGPYHVGVNRTDIFEY